MTEVTGGFSPDGAPILRCNVIVQSLLLVKEVEFLVDTGAGATCLHDLDTLGAIDVSGRLVDWSRLEYTERFGGVGGMADYSTPLNAHILMPADPRPLLVPVQLRVVRPGNSPIRSLLGRDVLSDFEMLYSPSRSTLSLRPV